MKAWAARDPLNQREINLSRSTYFNRVVRLIAQGEGGCITRSLAQVSVAVFGYQTDQAKNVITEARRWDRAKFVIVTNDWANDRITFCLLPAGLRAARALKAAGIHDWDFELPPAFDQPKPEPTTMPTGGQVAEAITDLLPPSLQDALDEVEAADVGGRPATFPKFYAALGEIVARMASEMAAPARPDPEAELAKRALAWMRSHNLMGQLE